MKNQINNKILNKKKLFEIPYVYDDSISFSSNYSSFYKEKEKIFNTINDKNLNKIGYLDFKEKYNEYINNKEKHIKKLDQLLDKQVFDELMNIGKSINEKYNNQKEQVFIKKHKGILDVFNKYKTFLDVREDYVSEGINSINDVFTKTKEEGFLTQKYIFDVIIKENIDEKVYKTINEELKIIDESVEKEFIKINDDFKVIEKGLNNLKLLYYIPKRLKEAIIPSVSLNSVESDYKDKKMDIEDIQKELEDNMVLCKNYIKPKFKGNYSFQYLGKTGNIKKYGSILGNLSKKIGINGNIDVTKLNVHLEKDNNLVDYYSGIDIYSTRIETDGRLNITFRIRSDKKIKNGKYNIIINYGDKTINEEFEFTNVRNDNVKLKVHIKDDKDIKKEDEIKTSFINEISKINIKNNLYIDEIGKINNILDNIKTKIPLISLELQKVNDFFNEYKKYQVTMVYDDDKYTVTQGKSFIQKDSYFKVMKIMQKKYSKDLIGQNKDLLKFFLRGLSKNNFQKDLDNHHNLFYYFDLFNKNLSKDEVSNFLKNEGYDGSYTHFVNNAKSIISKIFGNKDKFGNLNKTLIEVIEENSNLDIKEKALFQKFLFNKIGDWENFNPKEELNKLFFLRKELEEKLEIKDINSLVLGNKINNNSYLFNSINEDLLNKGLLNDNITIDSLSEYDKVLLMIFINDYKNKMNIINDAINGKSHYAFDLYINDMLSKKGSVSFMQEYEMKKVLNLKDELDNIKNDLINLNLKGLTINKLFKTIKVNKNLNVGDLSKSYSKLEIFINGLLNNVINNNNNIFGLTREDFLNELSSLMDIDLIFTNEVDTSFYDKTLDGKKSLILTTKNINDYKKVFLNFLNNEIGNVTYFNKQINSLLEEANYNNKIYKPYSIINSKFNNFLSNDEYNYFMTSLFKRNNPLLNSYSPLIKKEIESLIKTSSITQSNDGSLFSSINYVKVNKKELENMKNLLNEKTKLDDKDLENLKKEKTDHFGTISYFKKGLIRSFNSNSKSKIIDYFINETKTNIIYKDISNLYNLRKELETKIKTINKDEILNELKKINKNLNNFINKYENHLNEKMLNYLKEAIIDFNKNGLINNIIEVNGKYTLNYKNSNLLNLDYSSLLNILDNEIFDFLYTKNHDGTYSLGKIMDPLRADINKIKEESKEKRNLLNTKEFNKFINEESIINEIFSDNNYIIELKDKKTNVIKYIPNFLLNERIKLKYNYNPIHEIENKYIEKLLPSLKNRKETIIEDFNSELRSVIKKRI